MVSSFLSTNSTINVKLISLLYLVKPQHVLIYSGFTSFFLSLYLCKCVECMHEHECVLACMHVCMFVCVCVCVCVCV